MRRHAKHIPMGRKAAAFVLAATLATGAVVTVQSAFVAPQGASAASVGPGFGTDFAPLRAYTLANGTLAYCLEPDNTNHPVTGPDDVAPVGAGFGVNGKALSGDELRKLNWAITNYGQRGDNVSAAATQLFVWSITDPQFANRGSQGGRLYYGYRIDDAGQRNAALALYDQMVAESGSIPAPAPAGQSAATLDVAMVDGYNGTITVTTTPANATGTITIQGAGLEGSGANTAAVTNGQVLDIVGTPTDADSNKYNITVTGTFTGTVDGSGFADEIQVRSYAGQQQLAAPGRAPNTRVDFDATAGVADPELEFRPEVQTEAPQYVGAADAGFSDTLTANVAAGTTAWRQYEDGSYEPIVTTGTLYGPFTTQPTESAMAPAGAPVAAENVKVTLDKGPGVYASPTVEKLKAGYYTWVWSIDAAEQDEFTRVNLLPEGYTFADAFGQVMETQFQIPNVTTKAVPAVAWGATATDTAIVDGTAPTGSTVTFELYQQPEDVTEPTCTPDTLVFDSSTEPVDVTGAGEYVSPASDALTETGTYYWIEKLWGPDRSRTPTLLHEGECGLPNETTVVDYPTVTTKAVADVVLGGAAHDTAIVDGLVPVGGAELTFTAYKQPEGATAPVCTPENAVFSTTDTPVTVTEAGEYNSANTTFTEAGTYYWVEVLTRVTPDDEGSKQVIHEGECGAENETTTVTPAPPVPLIPNTPQALGLANTGSDTNPLAFGGIGAAFLLLGGAVVVLAKRRPEMKDSKAIDVE